MKTLLTHTRHYRPSVKALALVVFLATPGAMLMLPLLAWWVARRPHKGAVLSNG